jgi:hypothetical protein
MYRRIFLPVLLVLLLILPSCSSKGKIKATAAAASGMQQQSSTQAPASTASIGKIQTVPAESKESLPEGFIFPQQGIRPVAVMIDNEGTRSLPQGGLDKAQVIYEIIVEGGETRLMPIFWGTNPTMIGSVRSSRHYFLDYAMEHDAIYVHFGWSPMARADISKLKINNINGLYADNTFWDLTKDRGNWQDSYTSMERVNSYIEKVKYRTDSKQTLLFTYNETGKELNDGEKAEKISIRYSFSYTCGFTYDNASGMYKRLRKGKPQMERVSDKQLEASNIIIQYVPSNTIKGDREGRQELRTVGSGKGYFVTLGKAVKIKWSKESRNAPSKYTDEKGNEIVLNPGQTWVQVVPAAGKVTIE